MTNDFHFTVPGRPYIKKNNQRAYGSGRFKRIVYSEQYLKWAAAASIAIQMAKHAPENQYQYPMQGKLNLRALFYFKDHQSEPDLSALYEVISDVLEKMRVIDNDKQIYGHNGSTKIFGEGEPRVEVELTRVEVELTPWQKNQFSTA